MSYAVKEIFRSIQGEGIHAGRVAVFLRFSGCNLGYGVCPWCDTDWIGTDGPGGGRFDSAESLAEAVAACWGPGDEGRFCVLTGGEPLVQLDGHLVAAIRARGFFLAVETNGTRIVDPPVDWITVSPKSGAPLMRRSGHELKLVFPQPGLDPADFESLDFRHFVLQPMSGVEGSTPAALAYVLEHPRWRLGPRLHMILGLP